MGFKNKLQYKIILLVFGMLLLVGEMTQSLSDKSPAVDGTLLSQLLSTTGHACSTPKDHIVGRACLMLIVVEQGCRRTPHSRLDNLGPRQYAVTQTSESDDSTLVACTALG